MRRNDIGYGVATSHAMNKVEYNAGDIYQAIDKYNTLLVLKKALCTKLKTYQANGAVNPITSQRYLL